MNQLPIHSAKELFKLCRIQENLNEWRPLAGVDVHVFDKLFGEPMHRFAEIVQLAPASEAHHHSGPGGLLTHTFDVITLALKKRRGYQLPLGGTISEINEQRHVWTFGIFVACLLHDIGKISANIRLYVKHKDGSEKYWNAHSESLCEQKTAVSYRIVFEKTPYEYHHKIALTHFDIFPGMARSWLMQAPQVMIELCAYLWGDRYESGVIGQIAEFADGESTARNLMIPADHRFSNAVPVIDRYLKIIRRCIWKEIKINVSGGMGWVDNNGHLYLVCRALALLIIKECDDLGLKGLPQDPVRIYDILQEHGYAIANEDGRAIWNLEIKGRLINDKPAFVHDLRCLKFEARKFSTPTKILPPFDGEINVLTSDEKHAPLLIDHDSNDDINKIDVHIHEDELHIQETGAPLLSATPLSDAEHTDIIDEANSSVSNEHNIGSIAQPIIVENAPESESAFKIESLERPFKWEDDKNTGERFLHWLQKGLIEKTILINNRNTEVHIVEEGVFLLAPAIFKTFLNRHGLNGEALHKNMSKRFSRLRINIRTDTDMNIHPYWVFSNSRATRINGWLLPFDIIYGDSHPIPKPNKYIKKNLEDKKPD